MWYISIMNIFILFPYFQSEKRKRIHGPSTTCTSMNKAYFRVSLRVIRSWLQGDMILDVMQLYSCCSSVLRKNQFGKLNIFGVHVWFPYIVKNRVIQIGSTSYFSFTLFTLNIMSLNSIVISHFIIAVYYFSFTLFTSNIFEIEFQRYKLLYNIGISYREN